MGRPILPARASVERLDNRLAFTDHGLFTQHHAIGRNLVIQAVWVYEHAVDFDGLKRFHHNLGYGLLGRRIERSPLPFARHRWVLDRWPSDIDVDEATRPRAELADWADEQSQLTIDAESGPGWRLGVVPLADGATAISLVVSHYLIDGLGLILALADAITANLHELGYPPPQARPRIRGAVRDAGQTARDTPEVARAVRIAARLARQQKLDSSQSSASRPVARTAADSDEHIVVPGITASVDLADWDLRAKALGATSNTLGAAFAAKLGELIGRRHAGDGAVTLLLPINNRGEGDTRANAMSFARVSLDPTGLTTDLGDARSAVNQALKELREAPDDTLQVAWLASFTPKRALKRMDEAMVADPDSPVFYSNLGDAGSFVNCVDGTPSEFLTARVLAQRETRGWLERAGGQMTLQSARLPGNFVVSINAYQPGFENTTSALRELAARALAEFDLTGKIE